MTEPSICRKPKIRKLLRITDPPAPFARMTFQHQVTPAVHKWLASKAVIHENVLAQTSSSFDRNRFQSRDKPKTSTFASNAEELRKPKNFEYSIKDGQHPIWTCEKFKSLKVNEQRELV